MDLTVQQDDVGQNVQTTLVVAAEDGSHMVVDIFWMHDIE